VRREREGLTPQKLEEAAREAREDRAARWDEQLQDADDDLGDLEPIKAEVTKPVKSRSTVGLRLAPGEMAVIELAAKARGMSFSEFVRSAALIVASGHLSLEDEKVARQFAEILKAVHDFQSVVDYELKGTFHVPVGPRKKFDGVVIEHSKGIKSQRGELPRPTSSA
jgi:uncharacterized protein (DUF1778 family)